MGAESALHWVQSKNRVIKYKFTTSWNAHLNTLSEIDHWEFGDDQI